VTIEHGHANDRSDYFSSVAYWYQSEPHKSFPPLPPMKERIPFALESPRGLTLPEWEELNGEKITMFRDRQSGMVFKAENLSHHLTSFYDQTGIRYPALSTEKAKKGTQAALSFSVEFGEQYNLEFYFLRGPSMGNFKVSEIKSGKHSVPCESEIFEGYSSEKEIAKMTLENALLQSGTNEVVFQVLDKAARSEGMDLAFVGLACSPSRQRFITDWNLIGPFNAPDMTYLQVPYPPEKEINLEKKYKGKNELILEWKKIQTEESGFINLAGILTPNEQAIAYGLVYVFSPERRQTHLLLGSDDGVRIWLNEELIHTNPAYRGAYPDQDKIPVTLEKGWNKLLVKVLQGGGGWGCYVRFIDPEGVLRWSAEPQK